MCPLDKDELADRPVLPGDGTLHVRVILAGQQHLLGQLLSSFIEEEPGMSVTGICEDEASLSQQLDAVSYDLMLLDPAGWHAPAAGIVRQIARLQPNIRIIVLTADPHEDLVRDVFRAGAKACLATDRHLDSVLAMIRLVTSDVGAAGITHLDSELNPASQQRGLTATSRTLTKRQTDVLKALVRGATNKEIALLLGLRDHTVKNYVTQILNKFGVRDRTGAVLHALRTGLISESDLPTTEGQVYSWSGNPLASRN